MSKSIRLRRVAIAAFAAAALSLPAVSVTQAEVPGRMDPAGAPTKHVASPGRMDPKPNQYRTTRYKGLYGSVRGTVGTTRQAVPPVRE
jgi:hypothetical protein